MASLQVLQSGSVDREAMARELAAAVEGEVRFGLHDRMLYATDASLYQVEPLGVVIPSSVEDAARAVAFCAARRLPILPRGGGTSLAGQCTSAAIVIDLSACCRALRRVDEARRTCDVEPGITVDDLNDVLAPRGLFFAPDPATSRQANIGGCIGNNAAGARSILYGRTSENVDGVDVLRPGSERAMRLEAGAADRDPQVRELTQRVAEVVIEHAALIRERFPKTVRRNAGYNLDLILNQIERAGGDAGSHLGAINLAGLICGSEGTLGVVLGARLKLHPVPKARGLALIGFDALESAVGAVGPILATRPSAVELVDDLILDLARANVEHRGSVELMPVPADGRDALRAVLLVEYFSSEGAEALEARFAELTRLMQREAPGARVAVCDAPTTSRAWKLRKAGEPLLHGMPGDRKPITFVEDNAVPPERLPEFVREFRRIVERHGTRASFWAHASVGVLHIRPLLDIRDEHDRRRLREIAVEAADLARSLGGVMSGEHGDGRVRGPLLERFYGPELMRAFRRVKQIFDPLGLLNPGNIVDAGPLESITERLRVSPHGRNVGAGAVDTWFSFDDQHGLGGAVEMCNGAGVCRKKSGGTMCPSYMATLDERHSTRGRGNALRLAITGQLSASEGPAWNDPETVRTLDLCLSCKACKAECPSNVDIARLKAEYTAQRYRAAGRIPLAARFFGAVRALNRLGSLTPDAANWLNARPVARGVLRRLVGIDPRRTLPPFRRSLARRWCSMPEPSLPDGAPVVALFGDCFTMYNEPEIGEAARRVLEAFGYRVRLVNAGCCGRAQVSMGLLDAARATIDRTLARLGPAVADSGLGAVIVLEPSCLSAIKDDWLMLKVSTPLEERRRVAEQSWLLEDFLERRWREHPRRPGMSACGPTLLHGHCHQKALWGIDSSAALLRRLVGTELRVLDSGCCGLAGSFGYTSAAYDVSMAIGELALLPEVRSAPGAVVVAPGTSCRHQIKDGTGAMAMHPAQLLDRMIRGLGPGMGPGQATPIRCSV